MRVDKTNLRTLETSFKALFQKAFDGTEAFSDRIATKTSSGTAEELYAWLGQFPRLREWIGPRVINNLVAHGYSIKNKLFESTIQIPRTSIEDDQYGIYAPMASEMGRAAKEHPDELLFQLLASGFTELCYDGKPFFSEAHPVLDIPKNSKVIPTSNMQSGSGAAWFLLDTTRAIRPLIWQERIGPSFTSLTNDGDEPVFWKDDYVYGVRARHNVGFGFWQLAFGSKAELNPTNYAAARKAMTKLKGDEGGLLGIRPDVLVVPYDLEEAARRLIFADTIEGTSNIWKGSAELIIAARL